MAGSGILAAFVLWSAGTAGVQPVPLARAIVDGAGASCPLVKVKGGADVQMVHRVNPDLDLFPITVCDAPIPVGVKASVVAGKDKADLPVANSAPVTLAILGDTGCRNNSKQDCKDPAQWPLKQIAQNAAAANPDLVVHVGDYNYRGTPGKLTVNGVTGYSYDGCSAETGVLSQNVPGSTMPDQWDNWSKDFFKPAAALLAQAPWVVLRGNHELCARGGPGWYYLMDPASNTVDPNYIQPACTATFGKTHDGAAPYALAFAKLRMVVMDSADACDATPDAINTPAFAQQFSQLPQLAGNQPTWLLTHRPLWAAAKLAQQGDGATDQIISVTLQSALQSSIKTLPGNVGMVLSGHLHRFSSLAPSSLTPQLVVGDSGVSLDSAMPSTFSVNYNGAPAAGDAASAFGYMIALVGDGGTWTGTLYDPSGKPKKAIAACGQPVKDPEAFCTLK